MPRQQRSAVGPSLLLGTRCLTVYETRQILPTAFGGISKPLFSPD